MPLTFIVNKALLAPPAGISSTNEPKLHTSMVGAMRSFAESSNLTTRAVGTGIEIDGTQRPVTCDSPAVGSHWRKCSPQAGDR